MSYQKVVVLAVVFVIGGGMSLVSAIRACDWAGFFLNLGTGLMGAVAMYIILDRVERERYKRDLIRRMGSRVHDVAIAAAEELGERGWHRDGSLRGANLWHAKLRGANLGGADLRGALLGYADLRAANLGGADLRGAILRNAWLQGAILADTKLQRANLKDAHLEDAKLWGTHLQCANLTNAYLSDAELLEAHLEGANLLHANLKSAFLEGRMLNSSTVLPDATYWKEDTDMDRFRDPKHEHFWDPLRGPIVQLSALSAAKSNRPAANETPDVS